MTAAVGSAPALLGVNLKGCYKYQNGTWIIVHFHKGTYEFFRKKAFETGELTSEISEAEISEYEKTFPDKITRNDCISTHIPIFYKKAKKLKVKVDVWDSSGKLVIKSIDALYCLDNRTFYIAPIVYKEIVFRL